MAIEDAATTRNALRDGERTTTAFVVGDDLIAVGDGFRAPDMMRVEPSPERDAVMAELAAFGGRGVVDMDVKRIDGTMSATLLGASHAQKPSVEDRSFLSNAADYWTVANGTKQESESAVDRIASGRDALFSAGRMSEFTRSRVREEAVQALLPPASRKYGRVVAMPETVRPVDHEATLAIRSLIVADQGVADSIAGRPVADRGALADLIEAHSRKDVRGSFEASLRMVGNAELIESSNPERVFEGSRAPILSGSVSGYQSPDGLVVDEIQTRATLFENVDGRNVTDSRVEARSDRVSGVMESDSARRREFASVKDALFMEADRLFLGSVSAFDRTPPIEITQSDLPSIDELKARVGASERGVVVGDFAMKGSPVSGRLAYAEDLADAGREFERADGKSVTLDKAIGSQILWARNRVPAAEMRVVQDRAAETFLKGMAELGAERPNDRAELLGRSYARFGADPSTLQVTSVVLAEGRATVSWRAGKDDTHVAGSSLVRTAGEPGIVNLRSRFDGYREQDGVITPDGVAKTFIGSDEKGLKPIERGHIEVSGGYKVANLSVEGSSLFLTDPVRGRIQEVTSVAPRLGMDLEALKAKVREDGGIVSTKVGIIPDGGAPHLDRKGVEISSVESFRPPHEVSVRGTDDLVRSLLRGRAAAAARESEVASIAGRPETLHEVTDRIAARFGPGRDAERGVGISRQAESIREVSSRLGATFDVGSAYSEDGKPTRAKGPEEGAGIMARLSKMVKSAAGRG